MRGVGLALRSLLRTRIVAGLLLVVPIWVTWLIVKFVFDTMRSATEPIAWWVAQHVQQNVNPVVLTPEHKLALQARIVRDAVQQLLSRNSDNLLDPDRTVVVNEVVRKLNYVLDQIPGASAGVLSESTLTWLVPVLAVLLTLCILYVLGLFTANVFGRRVIASVEHIFERLPLIKTVYSSIKQIVMAIGGFQGMQFQRVVLIDFPAPGYKRVAFLTSVMADRDTGRRIASIFIPYTPYLTTGYLQLVPLDWVTETDWTVEEAVKWVMSGGIIHPEAMLFEQAPPVRWEEAHLKADAAGRARAADVGR
jgi:uncharacterized membrane protein